MRARHRRQHLGQHARVRRLGRAGRRGLAAGPHLRLLRSQRHRALRWPPSRRTAPGASFSSRPRSALAVGTYTARAEQVDARRKHRPQRRPHLRGHLDGPGGNLPRRRDGRRPPRLLAPRGGVAAPRPPIRPPSANTGTYLGGPTLGQAGVVPMAQSTAIALDGADDSVRVPSSAASTRRRRWRSRPGSGPPRSRPPPPRSCGRTFSTCCGSAPAARSPSGSGAGRLHRGHEHRRARSAPVPGTTWWPPSTAPRCRST